MNPFRSKTVVVCDDRRIKIPAVCPETLLRQKYKHTEKWVPHLQKVFCDFQVTIEAVKRGEIVLRNFFAVEMSNSEGGFGFSKTVIEIVGALTSKNYSIFEALLFRLFTCQNLLEKTSHSSVAENSTENSRTRFWVQLFMDYHLDLCLYMQNNDLYSDEQLTDCDQNLGDVFRSALSCHYPSRAKVLHCGELPQLTPCTDMGNLWYEIKKKKQKSNSLIWTLVHLIASKTQGHKCYNRNLLRIIFENFETYPILIELVRLILHVSLLGNYLHAKVRPPFEIRLQIRNQFAERKVLNDKNLFLWMMENEQIVRFAIKEFYTFMVEEQGVLEEILNVNGTWEQLKTSGFRGMDIVRTSISVFPFCGGERFESVKHDLHIVHQKDTLPYTSKLRKGSFLEVVLPKMNEYREMVGTEVFSTGIQCSELLLSEYYENEEKYILALFYMHQIIEVRYDKKNRLGSSRLELKWLKCFGITERGYWLFKTLYYDYEHDTLSESAIGNGVNEIYEDNVRNFHLIRVFLKQIQQKLNGETYELSLDYAVNQLAALRAKHHVEPWASLPPNADLFHYCSVCGKWANPVTETNEISHSQNKDTSIKKDKGKMNTFALGYEKATSNDGGVLVCGKQKNSIAIKKLMQSQIYYKEEIKNKKKAKAIRNHKETVRCCDTPLKSIQMLGICKKIDGIAWALCEKCATPTTWEGWKMGSGGFTCGNHDPLRLPTNTMFLNAAEQLFRSSKSPDESEIQKLFCSVSTVDKELIRCLYCGKEIEQAPTTVTVLRDDKNFVYEDLSLCECHWQKCSKLYEKNRFVKITDVISTITRIEHFENARCTRRPFKK